jgi:pimeloyl-ACP methyl ester carboxylesterase
VSAAVPRSFQLDVPGGRLAGDVWPGTGPTAVLLHSGIGDRRSWQGTAPRLAPGCRVVTYDRRGCGESPPPAGGFTHLDDLAAVLDLTATGPVWLVGSSMGGGLALDAAVSWPERLAGLILIAPAVSGAPEESSLGPGADRLGALIDTAYGAGDRDEVNRLETWFWLDGPSSPEGRVSGSARSLVLTMNGIILAQATDEYTGDAGLDAWSRLASVTLPTLVCWGPLDLPVFVTRSAELARRIPGAAAVELPGTAHLPYLEQPGPVADLLSGFLMGKGVTELPQ